MNVIVFGAGKLFARFMIYKEKCLPDLHICCICDNDAKLDGKSLFGIPLISPQKLSDSLKTYNADRLLIVAGRNAGYDIYKQLYNMELDVDVYCIREEALNWKLSECPPCTINKGDALQEQIDDIFYLKKKPVLPYLECDIVDHCNLNCNGCGHVSNIAKECYVSPQDFERDVARLTELYENVIVFRIMGGEPLLHPKCSQFVKIVRRYFPYSDIRVVTNGLLVTSSNIDADLFETMRECGAMFDVSLYPPTCKMWFTIKNKLYQEKIGYHTTEPINYFVRGSSLKQEGSVDTFWRCGVACTSLRDGKMTRCGHGRSIYMIARYFGIEIDDSVKDSGYYSIHDANMTGWKLDELLYRQPFRACAYCGKPEVLSSAEYTMLNDEKTRMPWRANTPPQLTDWLYNGEDN